MPSLLFALGFLMVGLIGCKKNPGPSPQEFRIQISSEPVSLDPSLAEDGVALRILANTQEGLLGYDGAGELQHRMAESHSVSRDGRRYEFTLRSNARWSDGQPVRAEDFITGLKRTLLPHTAAPLAELLFVIRGAKPFYLGKSGFESVGVSARDGKLIIELERPTPYLPHLLTLMAAAPQRADVLAANGGSWPTVGAPSTGPFQITERIADRSLLLVKNPHYFAGHDSAAPQAVRLQVVQDESTAAALFDQGLLDVLTRVPALDLKRFREKGVVRTDPFFATFYLAFNVRTGPFREASVRRVVAAAIRKQEITQALGSGERAASSWIAHGLEGYYEFSESRLVKGKGELEPFVIGFDTSGRNSMIMEKIQQDVFVATGVRPTLKNMDWKSYVKLLRTDPPLLFRFGWLSPFRDPISHLQVFVTGSPNNHSGWTNAEYDRLVAEISALESGPKREAKIRRAQQILVEQEAAVIPIYHYVQTHAVSPRVKNFRANPFGVIRLNELR